MATPMLSLRGVTKAYGGRRVLDGVDLDVAPGEIVAVLGPNGSGKSTLLRVAATASRPDSGTVHVAGSDARADGRKDARVDALRDPDAARRRLSYVGQDAAAYDELTPAEHVRLWARLRGVPLDVDAHVTGAGLAAVAHRPCATLSRGQRQRLALAMAFAEVPPLLLLDEPFIALDAEGASALELGLRTFAAQGKAILVTLHDEALAARVADRVLRLQRHRLVGAITA